VSEDATLRKPTTGIPGCCARAASGQAATPPKALMKSRRLSFPKIQSGGIRAVRQNQRIIQCDVCDHPPACNLHSRSVQATTPA